MSVDVEALNVDLLSLTAHKIYGPKGVGALYVRRKKPRVRLTSQMDGGGHERGFRSGTLNVPGIVGFGKAAELCQTELAVTRRTRDACGTPFMPDCPIESGSAAKRTPDGTSAEHAERRYPRPFQRRTHGPLPDIAFSSGSACSSASVAPSHVLKAMGLTDALAHASLRFSVSRYSTESEVQYVAERLIASIERLRGLMHGEVLASR